MRRPADRLLQVAAGLDQVLVAAVLAWTWDLGPGTGRLGLFAALLLVPLWARLHSYFGLYDSHRLDGWRGIARAIVSASVVGSLLAAVGLVLVGMSDRLLDLAGFAGTWVALVLASRVVLYTALGMLRKRGADRRFVCVIGDWTEAVDLARRFDERPEWGLQVSIVGSGRGAGRTFYSFSDQAAAHVGPDGRPAPPDGSILVGNLEQILRAHVVDEVLVVAQPHEAYEEREAMGLCRRYGVQCRVSLLGDQVADQAPVDYIPGSVTWTVHRQDHTQVMLAAKRGFDVGVSALLLAVLSPLFVLVAALVKLSSPGPVLYRQARTGLRGREFTMLKFRTMIADADSKLQLVAHRNITDGPIFKDTRDWRVTPLGRILRRFSLDELPQLVNVLRGEMSLVGPRPLPLHESFAIEGGYRRRFSMKPGITCSWQVGGRSDLKFTQWMELDVEYVDNWSLREDVKLLLRTLPAVLSGKGAY